ncbi:MAG TPA: radical SAM protein [Candidatus Kapabacteria bacterium]|nr:radical SAM protein [Candidatus Kapabacteria bacterium]
MPQVLEKALTQAEKERPDILRVNEIFYSIQGEGSRAGERCIFIRLTGCGLRCTYCDTEYAFYEGVDLELEDILKQISSYDCKLIELTGGEPLEQEGVYPLIDELLKKGYEIMIETGGHVDVSRVDRRVKRIMDLKTPTSGMAKRNLYENIEYLSKNDEVKFVIGSKEDYEWSREMIGKYDLSHRVGTILMSPVFGDLSLEELSNWILADSLPVKMQVQLHKLIWPGVERGV